MSLCCLKRIRRNRDASSSRHVIEVLVVEELVELRAEVNVDVDERNGSMAELRHALLVDAQMDPLLMLFVLLCEAVVTA